MQRIYFSTVIMDNEWCQYVLWHTFYHNKNSLLSLLLKIRSLFRFISRLARTFPMNWTDFIQGVHESVYVWAVLIQMRNHLFFRYIFIYYERVCVCVCARAFRILRNDRKRRRTFWIYFRIFFEYSLKISCVRFSS